MKGDVYYLKDTTDHNRIVAKFVVENDDRTLMGDCYSAVSWYSDGSVCDYDYFAGVYCKLDSCTHWYFYGEDYDPELKNEKDSYYHLCGAGCFMEHIRLMCFVWKLASIITGSSDDYFDNDEIKKLVDTMLKDYFIQKETNNV